MIWSHYGRNDIVLMMKVKKGMFRIYITLSVIWFVYWYIKTDNNLNFRPDYDNWYITFFAALIPLPLYFILKWISEGFK